VSVREPKLLPWAIWLIAAFAYAIAIIDRSSLSALGPVAQEHFYIDATSLSAFGTIQLLVYAIMQIPVGVLIDRLGASVVLLSGGVLMAVGQIAIATVADVELAIIARVLVGIGDACSFISVMRFLPEWFSVRHLPILTQLTGLIGQIGQLLAVAPLAFIVDRFGWATGFVGMASIGLLIVLFGCIVLRDRPGAGTVLERVTGKLGALSRSAVSLGARDSAELLAAVAPPATATIPIIGNPHSRMPGAAFWFRVRRLLLIPGVRLGYWIHFTLLFSSTTFILLWGTPYLSGGLGLSQSTTTALLSIAVIASACASVLIGPLASRFTANRVPLAFGIAALTCFSWLVLLIWPDGPPLALVIVHIVVIASGGPSSMIAFEVGRTHAPRSFSGFSTGLLNTGGFTSRLLAILLVGLILDIQGAGTPDSYTLTAFNRAFSALFPLFALGLGMIMLEWCRTKRWNADHNRRLI